MNVINIDVNFIGREHLENMVYKAFYFTREVLDKYYQNNTHRCLYSGIDNIVANPIARPIHKVLDAELVNICDFLYTIQIQLHERNRKKEGDLLGMYCPDPINLRPHIELYVGDIWDEVRSSENSCIEFQWLFANVLIHELAHAAMDIYNIVLFEGMQEQISADFRRWREESTANAATLHIIEQYGDDQFSAFTKNYMLAQPDEYALGVYMKPYVGADFYLYVNSKVNGADKDLQDQWLDYVKDVKTTPSSINAKKLEEWINKLAIGKSTSTDEDKMIFLTKENIKTILIN